MTANTGIIPAPRKAEILPGICPANTPCERMDDPSIPEEGYRLHVGVDGVRAAASSEAGFFYAEKTLDQLCYLHPEGIPCVSIKDEPRYPYRSYHVDCVRHFFPLEELKRMADAAAAVKLNRFHWHFSDDQGWRIQSKVFPRLTEVGARRAGDHFGTYDSDEEEAGFYTQDEVRELVAYCAERHIEVVPEVDLPGHVTAILAAYPELSCTQKPVEVATGAGIFPDILCAGREETFDFLNTLLDELCELFPGRYFHIGGDEVPKTRWEACPLCAARREAEGLASSRELQGYLANRVAAHLRERGKRAIVFNEAALGGNLDDDIIVQLWNDDPNDPSLALHAGDAADAPNQGIGARMIAAGHDVVTSNMLSSYCDYPYAFVRMEGVYRTSPVPQRCEDIPELARKHVLGGEALCWAEYIRDGARLEHMAWPRTAAKAEALWTAGDDYDDFKVRMGALDGYLRRIVPRMAEASDWDPSPARAQAQMGEFAANLRAGLAESYAAAQNEV